MMVDTQSLTEAQLAELRELLEAERHSILARSASFAGESHDPGDQQDLATREDHRRAEIRVTEHDRHRLLEIDAAIGRLDRGAFGVCIETGEPIPFARLRAQPTTQYTVEALELVEDEAARSSRRESDQEDDAY